MNTIEPTSAGYVTIDIPTNLIDEVMRENCNNADKQLADYVRQSLRIPNATTREAIAETRSGRYAGTIDTSSMEAFTRSLGL